MAKRAKDFQFMMEQFKRDNFCRCGISLAFLYGLIIDTRMVGFYFVFLAC